MKSGYTCPVCHSEEFYQSDMEGYTDMCDCCACNKLNEDTEAKQNKELAIFKKRTGIEYTYNDFMDACMVGEVNKADLKRLPELKETLEWCNGILWEYEQMNKAQPELNFEGDSNSLPF